MSQVGSDKVGNMKGAKGRNPSRSPSPSLTQVLQVQELRSYIEREKGKPQSEARFKDSQGLRQARPSSATSAVSASGKTGAASSLSRFLTELGLSRYLSQFLQSGVEDLETALELTEADLERMGIALGHRIKILKRLRDLCGPREEAKTVAPAKHPEKPPLPPASTPSQPKASPKPAVKDGNDEQSGYEALMSVNERVGCWECYRTFFQEVGEIVDGKVFCTKICAEKYRKSASITCPCGQTQLKSMSIYSEGAYYCSSPCLPMSSAERTTSAGSGVDKSDQADIDDRASEDYSLTSKLAGKYRNKGQSTIKEVSFEGTLPDMRGLMESVKELSGWEAPADASFDLEREET